jgi:hypothetical protein
MSDNPHRLHTRLSASVAIAATGLAAGLALAGITIEEKPVSLLTKNVVMRNGKAYIPGGDLARALGGTARYDEANRRFAIQLGSRGMLTSNPGALAALAQQSHAPRGLARMEDPDSGTGGQANLHQVAGQTAFKLSFGGSDVMIEEEEHVLLRPGEHAFSIELLGRLLGGQSRFDPNKGGWVLPPGGPGSPLSFR